MSHMIKLFIVFIILFNFSVDVNDSLENKTDDDQAEKKGPVPVVSFLSLVCPIFQL
jgi:hypothetical protein